MDQLRFLCLLAIACNFVFATGNLVFFVTSYGQQAVQQSSTFQITIRQWLGITAVIELSYIVAATLTAILSGCMQMKDNFLFLLWTCHKVFHSLFQVVWLIVIAIMNWGEGLADDQISEGNSSSTSTDSQPTTKNLKALQTYLTVIIILQAIFLTLEWLVWNFYIKRRPRQMRVKSQKSMENSIKSQEETSNAQFVSIHLPPKDLNEKENKEGSQK